MRRQFPAPRGHVVNDDDHANNEAQRQDRTFCFERRPNASRANAYLGVSRPEKSFGCSTSRSRIEKESRLANSCSVDQGEAEERAARR